MREYNDSKFIRLTALLFVFICCWKLYIAVRTYGDANVKKSENEFQLIIDGLLAARCRASTLPINARVQKAKQFLAQYSSFLKRGNSQRLSKLMIDFSLQLNTYVEEEILQHSDSTRVQLEEAETVIEELRDVSMVFRDMANR